MSAAAETGAAILAVTGEEIATLATGLAPHGLELAPDIAPPEVLAMLAELAARIEADFRPAAWAIVDGGEMVGLLSLVRPFADRTLHIGYGVAPGRQGRGACGRAVAAVLGWARADDRVAWLSAETSPDNLPSQRVLARAGLVVVGERVDAEDGALLIWRADARLADLAGRRGKFAGGNEVMLKLPKGHRRRRSDACLARSLVRCNSR